MNNKQTGKTVSVTRTDEGQMLDRTQTLLNRALETDDREEKDYAIRSALQYLVFLRVSQGEKAELGEPLLHDNTRRG